MGESPAGECRPSAAALDEKAGKVEALLKGGRGRGQAGTAMGPPLGCGVCWSSKVKLFVKRRNWPFGTKDGALRGG